MRRRSRRTIALMVAVGALLLAACGGDGADGDVTPEPTASGAIAISVPAEGAAVTVPFEVSGDANVFEAALVLQALDPAGTVLCERRVQATSGTGTPGTWSTTLAFTPPAADEAVTLKAFSRSARDGAEENVVTRAVTVSAELPAIVIEAPACGGTISQSTIEVSGTASVFEGSLLVELREGSGAVLASKTAQTVGAPERGPWQASFNVPSLPAGAYEAVAYAISAKDGTAENVFAVPFFKAQ